MEKFSLRVAVKAPGEITVEQQVQWLARHASSPAQSTDDDALLHRTDLFIGDEARDIVAARQRARVLIGKQASRRAVDEYLITAWQDQRPAAELLEEARTPAPLPDLRAGSWDESADPATALVGPWTPPRDLSDGIERLERLQAIRRGRIAALGLAMDHVALGHHHIDWGHETLRDYGQRELGLSPRTVQRYRKLGRTLDLHPELLEAVEAGLDVDSAVSFGDIAETGTTARAWIALARHLGANEAQRLATRARQDSPAPCVEADGRATEPGQGCARCARGWKWRGRPWSGAAGRGVSCWRTTPGDRAGGPNGAVRGQGC